MIYIKKRIIFIFLLLFFFVSSVSAADDNSTLGTIDDSILNSSGENATDEFLQSESVDEDSPLKTDSNSQEVISSGEDDSKSYKVKFSSKDVVSKYGKKATFSVKVVDGNNNPLKNKLVVFKVNKKIHNIYSNDKGVASINIKLDAGKYSVTYSCDNFTSKNTVTFKNSYKITVYKWKSGANVKKNKKIKSNIPKSALVKKMVKAAKKGTPMIKFKGGKGKVVFITAGVHGNELSSQIAAMKLIKYLEGHPIKGTVYIIPFINPKGTASNVRDYHGVNLNKEAKVKGTISYKTVKLIKKFKCDAYGDFHCTKPGGKPGKDVAMGTYKPTAQSAVMAKFISKTSKVKCLIYKVAGAEYPGALEDVVSLNHIPAVTCEVITPHGKIAKGSVGKSLSMMKSLLKFNELL